MRVRLSDGTHEIEIDTDTPRRRQPPAVDTPLGEPPTLAEIEATLGRLLDRLRHTPEHPDHAPPFGFTGRDLDGVNLDSSTERAEPYDDGRDQDDEPEDEQQ